MRDSHFCRLGCLVWAHSLERMTEDGGRVMGPFWAVEKSRVALKSKLHKHDFCHSFQLGVSALVTLTRSSVECRVIWVHFGQWRSPA